MSVHTIPEVATRDLQAGDLIPGVGRVAAITPGDGDLFDVTLAGGSGPLEWSADGTWYGVVRSTAWNAL